jgi:ABC-type sugar transport system substrate-binding protein
MIGDFKASFSVEWFNGFNKTLNEKGFSLAGEPLVDGGDASRARSVAETALLRYTNIVGFYTAYDYEGPIVGSLLEEKGLKEKIVLVADGLIGADIPLLESGAIDAVEELAQFEHGYYSAKITYELALEGYDHWDDVLRRYIPDYPASKAFTPPIGCLTPENLTVYKETHPEVWEILTK